MAVANFKWPASPSYWNNTQQGFYNLDYFITINKEAPNYFWAHQFRFLEGDGGYMGLQTSADFKGETTKIALFSIWKAIDAAPAPDGIAEPFGHEGSGYSCRIKYNWIEGRQYRIRLWELWDARKPNEDEWWGAWVLDTVTLEEEFIGKILLPATWKWLISGSQNWVEYWGMQDGQRHPCSQIPYTKATYSFPTLENGTIQPKSVSYKTYGDCSSVAKIKNTGTNSFEIETGL